MTIRTSLSIFFALWTCSLPAADAQGSLIRILFLGDNGHHQPAARFHDLEPVLKARGIELTYTGDVASLNTKMLAGYDGLAIYANTTSITPEQESALLDFVAQGKGLIPIHCATYCFLNSPKYIELVGGQFLRHSTGVFRTTITEPEHPILKGYRGFESWDETYVHTKHNENRTVLEVRVDQEGKEPYTWIRTHGKGRVVYTAWGHDERTWGNPGFQNLIERGIRWAVGGDPSVVPAFVDRPEMTELRKDVKPFEFVDAVVPFYPAGQRWGVTGEPMKKMQKPIEPEESMKHYVMPVGFELQLFVSEPELNGKPISMSWDERGRLWILETIDYPNEMQDEPRGRDKIRICEDTDGDGKADKTTIFADKLSIPTSLAFSNGGVIVHQAPHTLFLKDTNGDDVADERRILFTGWSTGDTHAGPSNLNYGFDNWIYGIDGYSGLRATIGGERVSFGQGFYRFKPDGSRIEFLRNTSNNSWGVGFSEEGILFGSTANNNPSVHMVIPNRYYERVRGWSSSVLGMIADSPRFYPITDKVRQVDQHGNFTAAAGHSLYTARTYPSEYWNRTAFVNGPDGHLTSTFVLQTQGSDYRSKYSWNLLASDDEWAAPILADVGPDGHVWVIDWYNFIVQHNPTPAGYRTGKGNAYETELRDKKHGRIYRVVYKAAKPAERTTLKDATPDKLVATLKSSNLFWRRHAQRLLVERGNADVVPALIALVHDPAVDEIGLNPGAIHALWTLHGIGALDGSKSEPLQAAVGALKHKSVGVRRNALQVLPASAASVQAVLESGVLADADGRVRLAAFLALSDMPPSPEAGRAVASALSDEMNVTDRWIPDAITSAGAVHDTSFLAAVAASAPKSLAGSPRARDVIRIVSEHFGRGAPVDGISSLVAALGKATPELAAVVVAGLSKGWPKEKPAKLDAAAEESLVLLVKALPIESRGQLVSLASRWGNQKLEEQAGAIAASFLEKARDEKATEAGRLEAAQQLVEFRRADGAVITDLLALITPKSSPELATGLVQAAGRSEAPKAGSVILESLSSFTPATRPVALRTLLARPEWTESLLEAMEKGDVQMAELTLDQKQALSSHPQRAIADRAKALLAKGGGLPNADRQKVLDELMPLAHKKGDAVKGKEVYKTQCSKCHVHGSEGSRIGPDLTGMAVHPKEELLTNIVDPSRSVEGNFRVYTVVTNDNLVLTGLLASETKTSVELFDAEAKKHTVLREDIAQFVASTKSLMPEGFEKQISKDDVANLLEFLAQRGKFLPLPLDKAASIATDRGMFFSEEGDVERLVFRDWSDKVFEGIPFKLIDPQGGRVKNAILFNGPQGRIPPRMPKAVTLPVNGAAKTFHFLSGVSGWGFPSSQRGTVSLIVRMRYEDGQTEDHELKNGVHFADYIRRVDVPESKLAFDLRGQQIRYLAVSPKRSESIKELELVKGPDGTAPIVMAVTVEAP